MHSKIKLTKFDYLTLAIVIGAPILFKILIFFLRAIISNQQIIDFILTLCWLIYAGFNFWFIFVGLKIYYLSFLKIKNKKEYKVRKIIIVFVLVSLSFMPLWAQENLFDFRLSTSGANPKYTFIHNGNNWQGFVQVGTGYMLWEVGPQVDITNNLNITTRAGVNFGYGSDNLTIHPQLALILFFSWHNWQFLSVNEYTPVKGTEYYYEQKLAYKNFGLHLEAIYQNGAYQPFVGPSISLPLTKGDIFFWLAQESSAGKKLARVGYKITF